MNKKSILSGVMLTAGTAVGAGMFSLPVVASGMWFVWGLLCLVFVWYISYLSSIYLLEVNVRFEPGASFNTLVKRTLGKGWNTVSGAAITFLLFILLYAYFSAFGSMASSTIGLEKLDGMGLSQNLLGLVLGGGLALVVWTSTQLVGRISTLLVVGMTGTFLLSMSGFAWQVEVTTLLNTIGQSDDYFWYIWAAIPYFLTSFGFSAIVPSLYKFYGKEPMEIKKAILLGSLIALIVYALFLFVVFGNISRDAFVAINESGGNMGVLVNALTDTGERGFLNTALTVFSNFAIVSSFLGVGLGLFDYMADLFSFADTPRERLFTAMVTFLPPGLLSFLFPNGFIIAIGYAGVVCAFVLFLVPFLMVRKVRAMTGQSIYQVEGGNSLLIFFAISSIATILLKVLSMLGYLPEW
ncbi:MAG: aromatic amino acid transporter [Bacteroidota bacterium]